MDVYSGTAVLTTVTFTNPTGTATDPTSVTLVWRSGGTKTTWTYGNEGTDNITRVSTGVYRATLTTTGSTSPQWQIKWTGTGACAAVSVETFSVKPPPL